MKRFFLRQYSWAIVFSALLIGSFTYVLLDTFVIPKSYAKVVTDSTMDSTTDTTSDSTSDTQGDSTVDTATDNTSDTTTDDTSASQSDPVITDSSYEDDNIKISINTENEYNTAVYVADIQVTDVSYLKTALAGDTYGRNIKESTSSMAESNNAILAINGDYYGFRDYGYVLRNGTLYRDKVGDAEALVIDNTGNFTTIDESSTSAESLDLKSIWQILSFGPALIKDGEIAVNSGSEVSHSKSSNPRTAIGMISPLHYVIVVSDGRTNASVGLSLLELAQTFADLGCTAAYNLDGGGSSTMFFNGELVNIPTDGRSFGEREVSDIVYIGY